jgi:hypothetical protein
MIILITNILNNNNSNTTPDMGLMIPYQGIMTELWNEEQPDKKRKMHLERSTYRRDHNHDDDDAGDEKYYKKDKDDGRRENIQRQGRHSLITEYNL